MPHQTTSLIIAFPPPKKKSKQTKAFTAWTFSCRASAIECGKFCAD